MDANVATTRNVYALRTVKASLWLALAGVLTLAAAACSDPDAARARRTTIPTYDKKTGRLTELTFDRNKNGVVDTWTEMDGNRPLRARIDTDEDGTIDRWEYYDDKGALLKVGFSRRHDGTPDAWAYAGPGGKTARVEIASSGDERKIDRREFYDGDRLIRVEEDTDGDTRIDKWESYEHGALKTAAMDENGDGIADRRLTYTGGALVRIESEPDAAGRFTKTVEVK
jgi:hypothetical protein